MEYWSNGVLECWSAAFLTRHLELLQLLELLDLLFVICSGGCRIILWWFHQSNHGSRSQVR
jgi:hypothetical protein